MDTLVRGLPVPIIFLREAEGPDVEPIREVVDGQQRLRTVLAFIEPSCLADFRAEHDDFVVNRVHNEQIAGKRFAELDSRTQRTFLNYEFSTHVLPRETDDREVLQIFARLNATGLKLNAQELRNAQWFGLFKQSVYTLAYEQLERWRHWGIFDETEIARMNEVELTSELCILMMRGIQGKSKGSIDTAFKNLDIDFPHQAEVEARFRKVMDGLDDLVGPDLPRSQFNRSPLFYSLFAFAYDVMFGLNSSLEPISAQRLPQSFRAALLKADAIIQKRSIPDKYLPAFERRTSHAEARRLRLEMLTSA